MKNAYTYARVYSGLRWLVWLSVLAFALPVVAAPARVASVKGQVLSQTDGSAVSYAVVVIHPTKQSMATDDNGRFAFERVEAGHIKITVEFLGMVPQSKELDIQAGQTYTVDFSMEEVSFRMDEVSVVAQRGEAGQSTSSVISRQAMDHLQASSIKDVMALLPGVAISNSSFDDAQTLSLRNQAAGLTGGYYAMNSLGTSVLVDGAPVSNNANYQVVSPTVGGDMSTFGGSSPDHGVDMRSMSTDNVESIEVIRGIPSVEYGDMTSGAVLVKSKAGASPLVLHFRTNPNIYQVSGGKGFRLGSKGGDLNVSADYAYNNKSLTAAYEYYQRLNVKLLYTKNFGPLNTNTSVSYNHARDTQNENPDMVAQSIVREGRDNGGRFSTNGHLNLENAWWLKSIDYVLSGSYTDRHSLFEENMTNAMNLYSTARASGSVITNIPGMEVVDANGNPVTQFNGNDATAYAKVMPYTYLSHYDIYGKEINAYGKLTANFFTRIGRFIDNRILIGADYRIDGNKGLGLVFPEGNPPARDVSNASSGFRERPLYTIPFVKQLGVFAQEEWSQLIGARNLNITIGVRYDNVNGKSVWAPRGNASFDILPNVLTLRGGWGITAKAPTLAYLHPMPAYNDVALFNHSWQTGANENEQLLVVATNVFDPTNPDLQIATNRKAEIGLDLTIAHRYQLSVTAYDEYMHNGYCMSADLESFQLRPITLYKMVSGGAGTGTRPTIVPESTHNAFFQYYRPLNKVLSHEQGIEFELNLGRFEPIRTSFYLNGAYTRSSYSRSGYTFGTRQTSMSDPSYPEYNIAVYEPGLEKTHLASALTTLRVTHNIPSIGFVVTLTAQADWMQKGWTEYNDNWLKYDEDRDAYYLLFSKYIDRHDGTLKDFDPSLRKDPEFAYMFSTVSKTNFLVSLTKPYVIFNLNLTKEIGEWLTASFYVNNLFNSHPVCESTVSPGKYTELGIPIFFGFDLKLTIK